MAEDNYSRTEPASERRLAQARAGGDVPRSADLSSLLLLAVMAGGLTWWGTHLFVTLQNIFSAHFLQVAQLSVAQFTPESALPLLQQIGLAVAPFLLALFLAGLFAPMLLSGWVFAPRAMQFQGERLNPLPRLLRIFSLNGLFDALKAVLIWLLAGAGLVWFSLAHFHELGVLPAMPLAHALALAGELLLQGMLLLSGVVLLAVLLDAPWQWWRYLKRLAMTRAEVLAEAREEEGNPELKARIRARQHGARQGAFE
jgi:flagellar biosynthetic protein FlhB